MHKPRITWLDWLGITITVLILAAILFPVLAPRKNSARQTVCLDNQRTIGIAIQEHLQDHAGRYLFAAKRSPWSRRLAPYASTRWQYDCPTITHRGQIDDPDYGFNANLFGVSAAELTRPDAIVLTADLGTSGREGQYTFSTNPAGAHYADVVLDPRHNDRLVWCAADGHAAVLQVPRDTSIVTAMQQAGLRLKATVKTLHP